MSTEFPKLPGNTNAKNSVTPTLKGEVIQMQEIGSGIKGMMIH